MKQGKIINQILKQRSLFQNNLYYKNLHNLHFFSTTISQFKLPDLGEKIKEATIEKWHVVEGDLVTELQTLAEVSTDKLFTEIPAPSDAKIHKLMINEGDNCQVGEVLLELLVEDENGEDDQGNDAAESEKIDHDESQKSEKNTTEQKIDAVSDKNQENFNSNTGKILATPKVRGMAKKLGINQSSILGSGENGRILKSDIDAFLNKRDTSSKKESKPVKIDKETSKTKDTVTSQKKISTSENVDISGVKNIQMNSIEVGMVKSMNYNTTVPAFLLMEEIYLTKTLMVKDRINANREDKIPIMPFLIKTFSMALREYPRLNSLYFTENEYEFQQYENHNISVAIDTPNGLMAPNIKECQKKSIDEIHKDLQRLRKLATDGRLGTNELFGGTIGMSNIGNICGTYTGPLMLPNQICIVGIGKIKDEPVFINPVNHEGKQLYDVKLEKKVYLTYACDHRVLDGATVARFGQRWKDLLEDPDKWFEIMR